MDNAQQAMIIAFSVIVFVFALSVSMYLISQVTKTSEYLVFHADSTRFYDNVELTDAAIDNEIRYVSAETIIPTLYRYNKENFCVKIYDADNKLVQLFDLNVEGKVKIAAKDSLASPTIHPLNYAYKKIYNNPSNSGYYLYGAPWSGSPEDIKKRIDLFVNGDVGVIGNSEIVDYRNNAFAKSLKALQAGDTDYEKWTYAERFISYSYAGEFTESEDGDILITGAESKDKIIIIYKLLKNS